LDFFTSRTCHAPSRRALFPCAAPCPFGLVPGPSCDARSDEFLSVPSHDPIRFLLGDVCITILFTTISRNFRDRLTSASFLISTVDPHQLSSDAGSRCYLVDALPLPCQGKTRVPHNLFPSPCCSQSLPALALFFPSSFGRAPSWNGRTIDLANLPFPVLAFRFRDPHPPLTWEDSFSWGPLSVAEFSRLSDLVDFCDGRTRDPDVHRAARPTGTAISFFP